MSAELLDGEDPDLYALFACRALMSDGEAEVREQLRRLAVCLVETTAQVSHVDFGSAVVEVVHVIRNDLVARIGRECSTVDFFTAAFVEEAHKARSQLLGLPAPEPIWESMREIVGDP